METRPLTSGCCDRTTDSDIDPRGRLSRIITRPQEAVQATQISLASAATRPWSQAAAQTTDIQMTFGGNTRQEHQHRRYYQPQLLQRHGPRHGSQWQPGLGHHHGLKWLLRRLIFACSSPRDSCSTSLHCVLTALLHCLISSAHLLPVVPPALGSVQVL